MFSPRYLGGRSMLVVHGCGFNKPARPYDQTVGLRPHWVGPIHIVKNCATDRRRVAGGPPEWRIQGRRCVRPPRSLCDR